MLSSDSKFMAKTIKQGGMQAVSVNLLEYYASLHGVH